MTYDKDNIVFLPKPTHKNFRDIEGLIFGRWTVLGFAGYIHITQRTGWWCQCICGMIAIVSRSALISKSSQSCGCGGNLNYQRPKKHGHSKHPLFHIWRGMMRRCNVTHSKDYTRYGGRGIQVCGRWHTFEKFLEDMGERPSKKHSLERRNNNGNYEPDNCYWATRKEQNNNKSNVSMYSLHGKTRSLADWCRIFQISHKTVYYRLRYQWSLERALVTPIRGSHTE